MGNKIEEPKVFNKNINLFYSNYLQNYLKKWINYSN